MNNRGITRRALLAAPAVAGLASVAWAQAKYDPGASNTEIRIGNIAPTSGPASAYGVMAQVEAAYFKMINEQGGINGRKVTLISYDDAYSPPKTVEMARKLVESDEVLLLFSTVGTAPNIAIRKYMNLKKVPQLFIASGGSQFSEPEEFPYTMGWGTTYRAEARNYARFLLDTKPDAKIGILYQNDGGGKDLLEGFHEGLGVTSKSMIVAELSYEITSATVDSEVVQLRAAGADVIFNAASPKFVAQVIRRLAATGWAPLHIVSLLGSYIAASIKPAGFDISQGIISSTYWKDPLDVQWANDPGMNEFKAFMDKHNPGGNKGDTLNAIGFMYCQNLVRVLRQAGDDLTRDNIMKIARNMDNWEFGLLLPGIKVNTGPSRPTPVSQTQMMRLKGEQWELFGPVLGS